MVISSSFSGMQFEGEPWCFPNPNQLGFVTKPKQTIKTVLIQDENRTFDLNKHK